MKKYTCSTLFVVFILFIIYFRVSEWGKEVIQEVKESDLNSNYLKRLLLDICLYNIKHSELNVMVYELSPLSK